MVEIMAEPASHVVREFHEICFDRTQFILRTVKAHNTFLRSLSETSPTHAVLIGMLTSQVSHISKSFFIFRAIISSNILAKYLEEISINKYDRELVHEIFDGPMYVHKIFAHQEVQKLHSRFKSALELMFIVICIAD